MLPSAILPSAILPFAMLPFASLCAFCCWAVDLLPFTFLLLWVSVVFECWIMSRRTLHALGFLVWFTAIPAASVLYLAAEQSVCCSPKIVLLIFQFMDIVLAQVYSLIVYRLSSYSDRSCDGCYNEIAVLLLGMQFVCMYLCRYSCYTQHAAAHNVPSAPILG